jgi:UDP-3-O-[3-hydroxymyristoyl] glucosamine N-acyltransferase
MPNGVINCDSKIGKHYIINTLAIIEHDCILEDFVHILPNEVLTRNLLFMREHKLEFEQV